MSLYLQLNHIKDQLLTADFIEDHKMGLKCSLIIPNPSLARLALKVWGLGHNHFSMMLICPDISFYLKKITPDDFKDFIDVRFRLYFAKIIKGWHPNQIEINMRGVHSYQKQTADTSLVDFFEEASHFLFKTPRLLPIIKVDYSNGHLFLSGYLFHIMQLFDSLHRSPPVRDLNHLSQLRNSQIIFYEEEIKRAIEWGDAPEVLRWKEICEDRLNQVNQGIVLFP